MYTRLAESGSGFYTDAEINQWLNDGVRDLAVAVEPSETSATVTTVADTREYRLPNDCLSVKRALYLDTNSAWYALAETSWERLFEDDPDWENDDSGTPESWYWRQNVIGLAPAPDSDNDGAAHLRILYTYIPSAMSGDSATTGMPEWLDDAVIMYAVRRGFLKDRDFERANAVAQEYSRALAEAAIKLNRHRKQHAPRLIPDMAPYRTYWMRGRRSGFIRIAT